LAIGVGAACGASVTGCLGGLVKPGIPLVTGIIALFGWPYVARIVRGQTLSLLLTHVDRNGQNTTAAGFLAFIPVGNIYLGALGEFLAAVSNRFSGNFLAGPGAVRIENQVLRWLGSVVGYPETAVGNLTSGGSMANLSAIVIAREAAGLKARDIERAVVYLTGQAHHCVIKGLRVAGLGECVLRQIPVDERFRMNAAALDAAMTEDARAGRIPWLVVATAGTTDTGAVDPLDARHIFIGTAIADAMLGGFEGSPFEGLHFEGGDLGDLVGGSHFHHRIRFHRGHASTAIEAPASEAAHSVPMVSRASFFGWRVMWSAFVLAIFGWGVGFYGPPVYLHAVAVRTGWSLTLVSSTATIHFLVGAVVVANLPALYLRFGVPAMTRAGAAALGCGVLGWAIAKEPWQLFAAALLSGAGWAAMGAAAVNAIVTPWFVRTRPSALATAYNGASIGGVVFSPLWVTLIRWIDFAPAAAAINATTQNSGRRRVSREVHTITIVQPASGIRPNRVVCRPCPRVRRGVARNS
jgi:hypothetical protein